jgi:hypothetical protein
MYSLYYNLIWIIHEFLAVLQREHFSSASLCKQRYYLNCKQDQCKVMLTTDLDGNIAQSD